LAGLLVLIATGALTAAAEPAAPPAAAPKAAAAVDLNRAGVDELVAVPGIGPATAQKIVEFREANGPFQRVEDLLKIKGIGEKSFEKLRPYFKVSQPS
jgi:competence protein ComEA